MISMSGAVNIIITLVVAMMIFGLLLWLLNYVGSQFPTIAPFIGVGRVILAILAVLVLVGVLLSLTSSTPIFRP